ncbi:MAG: hypothetical protein OCU20_03000 [Methanophagales archaeon]|nr:hypothetical protein [Methanophagales archaeon]MCW7072852.1 hypothetical protein [Methanophagales archaeon]
MSISQFELLQDFYDASRVKSTVKKDNLDWYERIVIFDVVTKMPNEGDNYEGIVKRGLKEECCGYIRREYEFSMAVCRSLARDIEAFCERSEGRI